MKVLGIETSCDETSVAVVESGARIRSNIVASQVDLHARYGGVVPEVASRHHVERFIPVLREALAVGETKLSEVGLIAVTNRPGLLGALLVGVSAAKALAMALKRPIVAIHHLEGHLYSAFLADSTLHERHPIVALIVSGGHTQLVWMEGYGRYALLGATRDDAAGEAFDKGARLLGLPYPGGPNLSKLAVGGDPERVPFPRGMISEGLDFSFSGLKTALRTFLDKDRGATPLADVAASYEAAIVDVLVTKLRRALQMTGVNTACVVGGVAANRLLQRRMKAMAVEEGVHLVMPEPMLCTDNAAMIAAAGYWRYHTCGPDALSFDTLATAPLATFQRA
ncbi:MAG TPA: tRNA (adenosine(37)-N6)-threonylcarbamoyltransferase complex transferase subunit TsaD [Chthonomonas sp.]|uniref:tRNA (adenosine(37)-N6)-threonylcarbamoyltransferase complex transferase subunit TsaD n=1 Tax=Chthonomonas sp. TaxID=2282153 RepID=UPI002B4ABF33|nr:tRNA (adenosine(37)-N6)-threonylcarbamoyltransferase complex transferase subunit TsaD [Chthonomonas sp.]HLI47546.1 tRNA (adenosine(37)-N6)-threonylcarbamoyltransferase complex transferase subunit TsaD [Chthonomonas sp.]